MEIEQKPFVTREEVEELGEEAAEENAIQRAARNKAAFLEKQTRVKAALGNLNTALAELVMVPDYNAVEELASIAQALERRHLK